MKHLIISFVIFYVGILLHFKVQDSKISNIQATAKIKNNNIITTPVVYNKQCTQATAGTTAFSHEIVTYEEVRETVEKVLLDIETAKKYAKAPFKKWSEKEIDSLTSVLVFGNNNEDFLIDYKLALSIMTHESSMKTTAVGVNKHKNGTISYDYGIGQHNSRYYRKRFIVAKKLHDQWKITDYEATLHHHDLISGSISTLLYLREIRKELNDVGIRNNRCYNERDLILAYNSGITGFFKGQIRPAYYPKVNVVLKELRI